MALRGERAGMGIMVMLALVVLLVLLTIALGHDRLSSQVLWATSRGVEGTVALALAESAVEEARFELARQANDPTSVLYDALRQGTTPAGKFDYLAEGPSRIREVLGEEPYRSRYALEDDMVSVRCLSQVPFDGFPFETRGVLAYRARVTAWATAGPKDRVVRDVEVRQEFKVALAGPPPPFDQLAFYVHDASQLLGLGRGTPDDPFPGGNGLLEAIRVDLAKMKKAKADFLKGLDGLAAQIAGMIGMGGISAGIARLRQETQALDFSWEDAIARYETAYGPLAFPEPRVALLCFATTDHDIDLATIGTQAWEPYRAQWRSTHAEIERLTVEANTVGYGDPNKAIAVAQKLLVTIRKLNELDRKLMLDVVMPPYFEGCRTGSKPRQVHAVGVQTPATPPYGNAIALYDDMMARFSKDRPQFREKIFYRVDATKGPAGVAFEEFCRQHEEGDSSLQGLVLIENAKSGPLVLKRPVRGRVVLVVEGDVAISGLPAADAQSLLTVICYGTLSAEGEIHAALISRGVYKPSNPGPTIVGSLILEQWPAAGFTSIPGKIVPDRRLIGSIASTGPDVTIRGDHQVAVLSPTLEERSVTRGRN